MEFLIIFVVFVVFIAAMVALVTPFLLLGILRRLTDLEQSIRHLRASTPPKSPSAQTHPSGPPTVVPIRPPTPQPTRAVQRRMPSAPPPFIPPSPKAPQLQPSALALWFKRLQILAMDWLLVRGPFAPKGDLPRETALAVHWLIRAGVITLLFGISFFVRWAILHGLLGPVGRCTFTALAGFAFVGGGMGLLRTRYRIIGEGLAGVGIVALYFSLYAATAMFGLLSLLVGFAGMAVLTFIAGGFALGLRLPSVAVLVTLGGMFTPVLLHAETANIPLLYVYLGMLSCGIGAGTWWRRWDALAVLGFALAWIVTLLAPKVDCTPWWFTTLHLLYVGLIFANLMHRGWKGGWLTLAALLANLAVFWSALLVLTVAEGIQTVLALVLAGVYALLAVLMRDRGDRRMTWCATLLALVCLALAALFGLEMVGTALAWCLLAMAAVELGHHTKESALTDLGQCFGVFALFATLITTCLEVDSAQGTLGYWVASLIGTALLTVHGWWRLDGQAEFRSRGFAVLGWICVLPYAPLFLIQQRIGEETALLIATVAVTAWSGLVPTLIRPKAAWLKGVTVLAVFAISIWLGLWLFIDLVSTTHGEWLALQYPLAGLCVAAHLFLLGRWAPGTRFFHTLSAVVFGLVLTRVAYAVGWRFWGSEAGNIAVSPAWALYALTLMALGLWRRHRAMRLGGLGLFAATIAKVFLLDMAGSGLLWKMLAAIPVGGLLILGAVLYLRLSPAKTHPPYPSGKGPQQ